MAFYHQAKLSGQLQLPDMETALSVLEQHWRDVDISRVVASLPASASPSLLVLDDVTA